jgi:hypothetical protein
MPRNKAENNQNFSFYIENGGKKYFHDFWLIGI